MPRTKDPDRDRYSNGRAKPIEGPTAETARKFQDKAAALHIPPHKEAGYAESTIGVLEARGLIGIEQAELCKRLANLRSVLYGSGNAKCSSAENVGRGLPNDNETKSMRDTWTAYKAAIESIEPADRRLFEHVILRNNYREWMKLGDGELFGVVRSGQTESRYIDKDGGVPFEIVYHDGNGLVMIVPLRRELRLLLNVIATLAARMGRKIPVTGGNTGYTTMSEAQRNALDGDEKLCQLYAAKAKREKK